MLRKKFFVDLEESLRREISICSSELDRLPQGNLFANIKTIKGTRYIQWEWGPERSGKRLYINKKNLGFARLLARRMYLKRLIKDKENELKCVSYFVKHRKEQQHLELLSPDSPYSTLLLDKSLIDWENQPYPKSQEHPEDLKIKAPKGDLVRSKSEAMIAQALYDNHIPYRYENLHIIGGWEIATDFTIMHPKTRRIILWEHFGKMDDPKYRWKVMQKLNRYFSDGYMPGRNLILTFEDSNNPFDFIDVQKVVDKYFT